MSSPVFVVIRSWEKPKLLHSKVAAREKRCFFICGGWVEWDENIGAIYGLALNVHESMRQAREFHLNH
jgi:hypothetical protein